MTKLLPVIIACVVAITFADDQNNDSFFGKIGLGLPSLRKDGQLDETQEVENSDSPKPRVNIFNKINKGITREVQDIKAPIEETIVTIGSSQCSNVKKLVGVAYDQYDAEDEPDVNKLTLEFITRAYTISFNIALAGKSVMESRDYNPNKNLYIFLHGFTDDPSRNSFSNISKALFDQGEINVLALDGSSLIKWLYLRSTTYVRFMGEKLGATLAEMVEGGLDPAKIHIIGHSLGAHIAGFTGKTFTELTGKRVGRISGLDPAGPCFSHVAEGLRLEASDADFVDVIHTDGGVFGLKTPLGDVDYYPNDGQQQPNCLFQTCSHSRAWLYYAQSVENPIAFAAARCEDWHAFKKGNCTDEISYMGFPSSPGTTGKFFLQTADESPFGLGSEGAVYQDREGITKKFVGLFG